MMAKLLDAQTTVAAGQATQLAGAHHTFQATVTGTGTVTANVLIQCSNNGTGWLTLGTITLSGTTSITDGFASAAPWAFVRANVTAISGTGAAVTVDAT
jgi:hypothetical protein